MKKVSLSAKTLDPFFEKLEKLSKVQRLLIFIVSFVLLVGLFGWFGIYPKYQEVDKLGKELAQLENDLRLAGIKAAKLPGLKKELAAAQERFDTVGKALPEKEEIPSLLSSISQSGQDSGLDFHLFQPKSEVNKEFYAEIPVSMTVEGNYHNVGLFFDAVSNLGRIVNIEDINIKPARANSDKLMASCTAVTYKFIEAEETKSGKGKPKKK